MSTGAGVADLGARAAAATEASATLFTGLREALAASLGLDLIDLRSGGTDGTWLLICRFGETRGGAPDAPVAPTAEVALVPAWTIPELPDPPFVSPVVSSRPFDGDGTDDLMRFIEEADPGVSVPALAIAGEFPPAPTAEERARMLASTIAGDVVLALMHDGVADGPERLGAALDEGWNRYSAEVRRLGREPESALYSRASDTAATMIVEGI